MRVKLEKDGKNKNLEVDPNTTLEKDFGSTIETWKEIGEVSKEVEADQESEKASQN